MKSRLGGKGGGGDGVSPETPPRSDARSVIRKRQAASAAVVVDTVDAISTPDVDAWGADNIAAKRLKGLGQRGVVKKHVEIRPPRRHNESTM
jgi:hypothetical protein